MTPIRFLSVLLIAHLPTIKSSHNEDFLPGLTDDNNPVFSSTSFFQRDQPDSLDGDVPIILWWTGRLFIGSGLKRLSCPRAQCYSTNERKYFKDKRTRGLYMYGTDIEPEDMPFPRKPHHEWALLHEESPMNNYMLNHGAMLKLFNHTATFRRESDYPLTTQSIDSVGFLLDRKPVPLALKNKYKEELGLAPVLYVQSHCDISSDRDRYVAELGKHIKVDSLGSCIHNKDIPKDLSDPVESMFDKKFYDLIAKYKFILAFENALCNDYITEKLFRTVHVGSVPIHRGSPSANDWMPSNHSLILAHKFDSPEALAKHILDIDANDEEYERYLSYKEKGITNTNLLDHMKKREWGNNENGKPDFIIGFECYVCEQISKRYQVEKAHHKDPNVALLPPKTGKTNHMNCPQPYPSVGDVTDLPQDDGWKNMDWIEDFWNGLDKAQALTTMHERHETDPSKFMKYWDDITGQRTSFKP